MFSLSPIRRVWPRVNIPRKAFARFTSTCSAILPAGAHILMTSFFVLTIQRHNRRLSPKLRLAQTRTRDVIGFDEALAD